MISDVALVLLMYSIITGIELGKACAKQYTDDIITACIACAGLIFILFFKNPGQERIEYMAAWVISLVVVGMVSISTDVIIKERVQFRKELRKYEDEQQRFRQKVDVVGLCSASELSRQVLFGQEGCETGHSDGKKEFSR